MNRLQKWFDQIAGDTEENRQRWALAQEIFATRGLDTKPLSLPACWRRGISHRPDSSPPSH